MYAKLYDSIDIKTAAKNPKVRITDHADARIQGEIRSVPITVGDMLCSFYFLFVNDAPFGLIIRLLALKAVRVSLDFAKDILIVQSRKARVIGVN